jgi:hypothetical protein
VPPKVDSSIYERCRVIRFQNGIINAVTPMQHIDITRLIRHFFIQSLLNIIKAGDPTSPRFFQSLVPAFNLTPNIAFGAPEVFKAPSLPVQGIKLRECINEILSQLRCIVFKSVPFCRNCLMHQGVIDPVHTVKFITDTTLVICIKTGVRNLIKSGLQIPYLLPRSNLSVLNLTLPCMRSFIPCRFRINSLIVISREIG